ncbi:MAG: hypothetical protein QXO70_04660 [Candidatus Pacearchaeota archaeon]
MFVEKCPNCKKRIEKNFEYCPYCGCNIKEEREIEDFGLLGKEDKKEVFRDNFSFNLNPQSIIHNMNSLIKNMIKDFDKEFDKNFDKTEPKVFSKTISINLSPGKVPKIRIDSNGKPLPINVKVNKIKFSKSKIPKISKEKLNLLAKLPKQEPKTNVRRFGDKVVYEFDVPGVKDKEDILINNLENGIEIIALSKEKAFVKKIPIKLELQNYEISKGKLIIEFKA